MEEIKASSDAAVSYVVVWWVYKCLPRKWAAGVLSRLRSQSSLQYSSLPGPSSPLRLGGYAIKRIFNLSPPRPPLAVSVTAITYADRVHLAVIVRKTLINADWMAKTLLYEMQKQCEQMGSTLSYRRLPGEHRKPYFSPLKQNHSCRPMNELQESLAKVQMELQRVTADYENEMRRNLHSKSGDFRQQYSTAAGTKSITRSASTDVDNSLAEKRSRMRRSKSMGHSKHCDKREELSYRVKQLKEEFTDLLSEIRRRKNYTDRRCSIGPSPEEEDDVRKSRKRTLSVASVKSVSSVKSTNSIKSTPSPVCVRISANSFNVYPRESAIYSS